jgi:hypothetical protein
MATIFISHSSADNDITKKIFDPLKDINRSIFLDFDYEHGIKGGTKWEKTLYHRVKKCRIMVVVLSSNWLDSQWCYKEYCMARVLKKEILPVVIEEDERIEKWDGKDLQHFDHVNDSKEAIDNLKKRVKELTRSDLSKLYDIKEIESPFPGLRSFDESEAAFFYGRNSDILDIVAELKSMADTQNEKFLNITGASGVGKSSFLKAGVLPYLELMHKESWYLLPTFRAKESILRALRDVVESLLQDEEEVLEKLKDDRYKTLFDKLEESVRKHLKQKSIKPQNLKIILPIDQAEELLTSSNQAEKEQFFKIVRYLLKKNDNFFVIWTLRSDQIKNYQDDKSLEFLRLCGRDFMLRPIAISELKAIIQEPAFVKDVIVDDEVVEQIKLDLTTTTSLPLLAYLLQKLYNDITTKHQKRITINDYKAQASEQKNPIESIINDEADEIYNKAADKNLIKELFINHLVKVNLDKTNNKKSAKLSDIPKELHPVIEEFVKKRLFIKDKDEKKDFVSVEIAHEALLGSWDKLARWLTDENEFLLFKVQLELLQKAWQEAKEQDKNRALLRGLSLANAMRYRDQGKIKDKEDFIKKSEEFEKEEEKRYKELYEKAETSKKEAQKLVNFMLFDLRDKLEPIGRLDILEDVQKKIDRYYKTYEHSSDDLETQRHKLAHYISKADIYLAQGKLQEAQKEYEKALNISKKLTKQDPNNAQWQRDLSVSYSKM